MEECTIDQCNMGSKCDPSAPYVCLTNGGCTDDPNLWINTPICNNFCDASNCIRSYKCNSTNKMCEKSKYLPNTFQHRYNTEKQCYDYSWNADGSKECTPPTPTPTPKPTPKPYPGQDNCYGRGTCVQFNAEGECTGCATPCDQEGYSGFFCGECKGGYDCIDPNGDRVDSPDCLPPNKCEPADNGPRWCDYSGGVCRVPDRGMSANFDTRVDCERDCKALHDTKFSCTKNGCVISDDGPFRATHRNPDNGTYYSEECESNCKFGIGQPEHWGGMRHTFFENKESPLWDNPENYGCDSFPCTKEEIDALKWVRMPSLKKWNSDEGSTLCRPVSDKMLKDTAKYPVGTPTYKNPLDCHNAFGNAGFWCYVDGGFCRLDESKNVGATLESCHTKCTASGDPTDYWMWDGRECVKTSPDNPDAYHRLENCLDNNASYSCTGAAGNYTCEPTVNGEYNRPTMAQSDCAADCHPQQRALEESLFEEEMMKYEQKIANLQRRQRDGVRD